ncbi:MAG: NnrS family protein [Allosphingosinicella sp.]
MMTRGEQMLALRRVRMAASPPFLRGGFRPFFFGGALWAVAALVLWLCALAGAFELPSRFDPLAWHRHEMLFGFVGAVISGFLLTAIPNWTGRLPIAGAPLAALFGLWVGARAAVLFSAATGPLLAATLDVGFFVVLAAVAGREVLAAKNRNLPIVLLVLLFGAANAADHAAAAGWLADGALGVRAAISLVVLMISLIGGRIVPSFTRNWLSKHGVKDRLPGQPGRYDLVTIGATGLALLAWIAMPSSAVAGAALVGAGLLQAVRLSRWAGLRARRDPLVLVLHVGYFWVPAGLLLLGASVLRDFVPAAAAIHALTAGAMATMILAVMTRSTLGHTGRELKANGPTVLLYVLITLGAVLRVAAPLGLFDYTLGMRLSALAWGGAFLGFLIFYGPILFSRRADEAS